MKVTDIVGVTYSLCGSKKHNWKKDKYQYDCLSCGKRITLKSETVMHQSELPKLI